jgi:hypothetical protein
VGLVSFFLPFFPLERRHVRQLFEMRLGERRDELAARGLGGLRWGPEVIEFLASRVGGGATASVCVSGRLFGWGKGGWWHRERRLSLPNDTPLPSAVLLCHRWRGGGRLEQPRPSWHWLPT